MFWLQGAWYFPMKVASPWGQVPKFSDDLVQERRKSPQHHWTYFWLLFLCSMRERDFIQVSESDGDEIRENGDAYLQKIKEKATSNKCLVYPSISMSSQEVKGESRWWLGGNHGQCTEVWFDSFMSGWCIFIEMVDHGEPLVQVSRSTRTEPAEGGGERKSRNWL